MRDARIALSSSKSLSYNRGLTLISDTPEDPNE